MKKFSLLTTIFFTFLFTVSLALAAVPKLVPYQGVLYDEQAMKPLNGVYSITFEIYDVPNGGTPVWTVNRSVQVENGYFNVMLGEVNPLNNVNFNKQLYLQITVANGTPYPRTKLGATPYAIQAISAVDADTAKVAQNVVDGVLTWQKFNPAAIVAGGDLQGTYPAPTLRKGVVLENIEPGSITQKYLAPNVSVPPAGKAGGDLAGQYPDPLIAKGAVKTDRLADGAVTLEKMANNSVSSANIIDGEVYLRDLNAEVKTLGGDLTGQLPNPTVVGFQNVPVSATPALHGQVYMLYKPNPDAAPIWVAMNAAGDVAGTWDNLQIQEGVVTTTEIADNTIMDADVNANAAIQGTKIFPDFGFQDVITTGDIYADNAYITNNIYGNNIYAANEFGAMNGKFDNLTVNVSTLLNGAVEINSNAVINGTVTGVNNFVLDGEPLTSGDLDGFYPFPIIRENAVTTIKILNGAVTNEKLADDAVTTNKILNNTILEEDIADGQISTRVIAGGAVTNSRIAQDAVTSDKILDGTIVSADIADGTIQTIDIGDGQITTAKLAAGAVTNNIIANDAVTSNKIMNGTIIDEDVNAAAGIQGTKINPNFGNQLVTTTGEVNASILTANTTIQSYGSILNPGPGAVLVDDDMNVTGNLTVGGTINLQNVNAVNVTATNGYFDNLWVYVSADIQGPILNSSGNDVLINDDLTVTGGIAANGPISSAASVSAPIISGNQADFTDLVVYNSGNFQGAVYNSTGNFFVKDNLDVLNAITAASAAFTGNVTANDAFLAGDLFANDGTFTGNVGVAGNVTAANFFGNLTGDVTADNIITNTITGTTGTFTTLNATNFNGGAFTGTNGTFSGTLTAPAGNITTVNSTTVNATTLNGSAFVGGTFAGTTGNFSTSVTTPTVNATTVNATNFNGGAFTGTNGTFSGNVAVTGNVTANDGIFGGNVSVAGTLQPTGSIVNPGANPVLVNDDMTVTGTLTVPVFNATTIQAQNGIFDNLQVNIAADFQGTIQNSAGDVQVTDNLQVTGFINAIGDITGNDFYGNNATFTGDILADDVTLVGNLSANNGTFAGTATASAFQGGTYAGTTGNFTTSVTTPVGNIATVNATDVYATDFWGGDFNGTNANLTGVVTAVTGNITTVNSTTVNATTFNGSAFVGGTFAGTTGNFSTSVTTPTVTATDVYATDFWGGDFNGTNANLTGVVTAVTGAFTGTVSAAQFNGTLQYGVQAGNGLLGGTFNNTANNIFTVNEAYAFNWTGNQTWAGTATFNNGLNVNGTTMLNDDVVIGDAVTDVVTINGVTTVQGIVGGGYDFTVDGDVDINGDANVDGTLTVQTLQPYDLNVVNDLTVGNNTTLGDAPVDYTLVNGTMNFANLLNPTIMFDGNASVGIFTDNANNALFLDGANAQFFAAGATENVIIDGAAGTVTASAGATIGDDETVDLLSVRAATNILGNVTIGSITPPYGYQTLIQNDGSNTALSVTGALTSATIPAFDVNGDAYIANAGTFNNPSLNADLYVYGNTEIDGNVYLGDAATDIINVTGISTFTGTGEFISDNANWTLRAENTNAGRAAQFVNHANSNTPAVEILNNGTNAGTMGLRIYNMAAGFGDQLLNVNSQVSNTASAAWFESMNTNLNEYAVGIRNTGNAPALYVDNEGTGRSALFVNTTSSTSPVVEIINYSNNAGAIGLKIQNDNTATNFDDQLLNVVVSGTNTKASAAWFEANNSDPNEYAVGIRNVGTSASLYVDNQDVSGTADALYVNGHFRQGLNGRTVLGFSQVATLANLVTATGTVIEYSDAANLTLNSITDFPNAASGTVDGRVIYIVNNTPFMMTVNNLSGSTAIVNIQVGDMVGFIYVTDASLLGSGWRLLNN